MIYVDSRDLMILETNLKWISLAVLEASRRWGVRYVRRQQIVSFCTHISISLHSMRTEIRRASRDPWERREWVRNIPMRRVLRLSEQQQRRLLKPRKRRGFTEADWELIKSTYERFGVMVTQLERLPGKKRVSDWLCLRALEPVVDHCDRILRLFPRCSEFEGNWLD